MKHIVTYLPDQVGPWVAARTGGQWVPGRGTAIGLFEDGKGLIAGVLFEDFNGANIVMHVAAVPGRSWLCREFLWFCFYYPFEQLKCKRVTGLVPSVNKDALRFDQHLGFELEATLKDAHPEGDLCVLVMRKEQCRWLALKESRNGQAISTSIAGLHASSGSTGEFRAH